MNPYAATSRCKHCGIGHDGRGEFCGRECRSKARAPWVEFDCPICAKPVKVPPWRQMKTCGDKSCSSSHRAKRMVGKPNPNADNKFAPRSIPEVFAAQQNGWSRAELIDAIAPHGFTAVDLDAAGRRNEASPELREVLRRLSRSLGPGVAQMREGRA